MLGSENSKIMEDCVRYHTRESSSKKPDYELEKDKAALSYDSSENDEAQLLTTPPCHSWEDSTEGSLATKPGYSSLLAGPEAAPKREKRRRNTLHGRVYSGFSFLSKSYHAPNGATERVTPFAVVLLVVLLAVYVLNQADRLVLPVVIPNGLRCGVVQDTCTENASNTSGVSFTGTAAAFQASHMDIAHSVESGSTEAGSNKSERSKDCIVFGDNEQGLLTG